MTKRAAFVAVVAMAALALAACGSSSKSSSAKSNTTKPKTTTTVAPAKAAAADQLATKLGCKQPKAMASAFPVKTTTVVCTAGSDEYRVNLYDRSADMNILTSAAGVKLSCGLAKAVHINGPLYVIKGNNYSVTVQKIGKNNTRTQASLAQMKALSKALGATVLTTTCTT
jgi:hypothetical protein